MRFTDISKEVGHHYAACHKLLDSLQRTWLIRDEVPSLIENGVVTRPYCPGLLIAVRAGNWGDEGVNQLYVDVYTANHTHIYNPLSMPAADLKLVVLAKEIVERYMLGIGGLPIETPREWIIPPTET